MDRPENWDQGAPEHRAWTQGPWHGDPADQGSPGRGRGYGEPAWQQGPWDSGTGFGGDEVFVADWTAATVAARDLARRVVRFLLLFVVGGFALGAGLIALAVAAWPHSALAVLLVLLAVPVLFVSLVTATAIWFGRRAWRSGGWMEAVPVPASASLLTRVGWAIRAALPGKASRRFGRRGRRAAYQARAGDLSGTTR